MDKRFWGFLVLVALVLFGIFFVSNTNKADAPGGGNGKTAGVVTNHVVGQGTSGVTLTEYGDFECPACAAYYPIVEQVKEKYGDRLKFQFRNYPLSQIHPNAIAAARAAEAADMQGKYWEMYNTLYANQQSWRAVGNAQPTFEQYAKELKLDATKFKADYRSAAANDRIQADLKEGTKLGVDSTPTFFINGKKISTPSQTVDAFSKIIDAEIAKKGGNTAPAPASDTPATTEPAPETTPAPAATPTE